MKRKWMIYARVSTVDQNVNQQVDYMLEWVCKHDYDIVGSVADRESGRLPLTKRKEFESLLEACKLLKCGIVIFNLDRLTRNWDDVTFIERWFRENWDDVPLVSTSDTIDLSNASGRMMFRIKMAVNCMMPEDMLEKQRIGIVRAKLEGKYKGRRKGSKNKKRGRK